MAKRVTTLFIRDTSINLLVMKGEQVGKWTSLPLEPGLVSQGLIVDEEQVAEKVKQIFKRAGAQTSHVITALSGHDSLYRIITLPELPDAVIPEAIRREAKSTIPTPLEEVYFSYQRLPTLTKGESRIFLATFPRNLVDALVRTLRHAGVKPYIMDLAPLALCRVPNEPRAIIVNARLDHMDVTVIADRLPQVIRRLSLPTESAESLEDKLPLIAEEFKRTITFYNSSHIENPLDTTVPVFVSGDLAEAPDTWQSAVGQSGYSVSLLPLPVELPEGFNPNEFMVNIGLAFKELLTEKEEAYFSLVNFNALPEAYVPPHFSILRVLVPVGTVIGVVGIILAVILILNTRADIESLRSEVTTAEASVAQQQAAITALTNKIGPTKTTANELSARATAMEQNRANIHLDLLEITDLAGESISLTKITHVNDLITVKGTATNVGHLYAYARDLRESPRFSKFWINSVTQSGSAWNFDFSFNTK